MAWKHRLFILVAAILGSGVLAFYWKVIQTTQGPPPVVASAPAAPVAHLDAPSVTTADPHLGPWDAKNTVVEFGDYLCPACKDGSPAIDRLVQARPDVRYVWKNDPSPLHVGADTAAAAAMCADKQGAFWAYHRKLFLDQSTFDEASLTLTAGDLDLNATAFGNCLASGDSKALVERTVSEGQALGIQSLPTYFINGKRYEGEMTYDQLVNAMDGGAR